ncbi:peptide/nickel transport system ATP-binding protein/oligopeptide transport system ATP-binding protein [Lachnotalea glycerini]|uniref:Peptide/nickel transport system ATP-binding protein/oligopeptide transport system ATP-binding protein n=1 Tax=Lachnotalea glycerini TaxID=1763509 RepID=A0A318EX12_9FIRM|nr:ABC transporter ATP-binding protein [Lachnotalea glycerini]PXV91204.1 peptide/nickel transport system ATP-binding protein/oligopeptide transport system ATP-binding protein [Lachnotalea glycerini]
MENSVLSIFNLYVSYGKKAVVEDVNLELKQGEILGIAGESGSGKSTLLKAILPISSSDMTINQGSICLKNTEISNCSTKDLRILRGRKIGMIFQNPKASFNPIRKFRNQFIETLKSHGKYNKDQFEEQIFSVFQKLSLSDAKRILDSYPYEMSGGMNQRIAIALAVMLEPEILLADEPTSALDSMSKSLVMDELIRLRDEFHMSIILVTHDMHVVSKIADSIAIMKQGKIVEMGLVKDVIANPKEKYTKSLLQAVPQINIRYVEECENTENPMLVLDKICKEFHNHTGVLQAVSQIDLQLKSGEILGIVGESGSGKSTLLKLIAGLEKASLGVMTCREKDMLGKRKKEDLRNIQMVFQNAVDSFNPKHKIKQAISESLKNLCGMKSRQSREEKISELMDLVGLDQTLANRYPRKLSGGQCQRAAIARAIAVQPEILLCDEITSALDVSVQAEIIQLLLRLSKERKLAIIFVSHDIALVTHMCKRIMVMKNGKCIEEGLTQNLIEQPKEEYTKQLISVFL